MLTVGFVSFLSSCGDDVTNIVGLTITAPTGVTSVELGGTLTLSFTVDAPSGISSATVAAVNGTATVDASSFTAGATTATIVVNYTAPAATTGADAVTLTVQDQGNNTTSSIAAVNVQVDPPKDIITVTDNSGAGVSGDWTKDNIYVIAGRVFVNSGSTLNIEAGTVIKGAAANDPTEASVLIVEAGGTLNANGTAAEPIVFTSISDSITVSTSQSNLTKTLRGLWGGLVIIGEAGTNNVAEKTIEGIPEGSDTRALYGPGNNGSGTITGNDDHSSGSLTYVSVRHGGASIAAGNEINGVSLYAVGRGTTMSNIEVFANDDDGFEMFGGTVNLKWIVSAYCIDDAIDFDEGYRGNIQFPFVIQTDLAATNDTFAGEHDGGNSPDDSEPYAIIKIHNATYIGPGTDVGAGLLRIRDNNSVSYFNSLFANFAAGVEIEDLSSGEDSFARFESDSLKVENCSFQAIGTLTNGTGVFFSNGSGAGAGSDAILDAYFGTAGNTFETAIFTINGDVTNPVPDATIANAGSRTAIPAGTDANDPINFNGGTGSGFSFETTTYKGAFDPAATAWFEGWSRIGFDI